MTKNPFDDDEGSFFALINHEEQYSLWPAFKPVPGGWTIAFGGVDGAPRRDVLDWIDNAWNDLRPKSLRDFITAQEQSSDAATVGVADTAASKFVDAPNR